MKWFKFICPISKPMMTETSPPTPAHMAYSPIVFLNHQWTINLHDGYPPPPLSLSMFCYQRSTSHHLFPPSVTSTLPYFTLSAGLLHLTDVCHSAHFWGLMTDVQCLEHHKTACRAVLVMTRLLTNGTIPHM